MLKLGFHTHNSMTTRVLGILDFSEFKCSVDQSYVHTGARRVRSDNKWNIIYYKRCSHEGAKHIPNTAATLILTQRHPIIMEGLY